MNREEMRSLVNDCCAAFNAKPPETRSCELWAEMCGAVPMAAAKWIRGKIIDLEAMPRNFGKAVLALFREWESTRTSREIRCPDCDPDLPPGHFWGIRAVNNIGRQEYIRVVVMCQCHPCREDDETGLKFRKRSKAQACREGFGLMRPGEKFAQFSERVSNGNKRP